MEASAFEFQPPFGIPPSDIHTNVYILIKAMDHFKLNVRMQELSCAALSMIDEAEPAEQRYVQAKRAGSAGVFPRILRAMDRFSSCEALQFGALMALKVVVTHCRFNLEKFIKAEGVKRVLDAMCAHPTSIKLQGVGMVLLVSINGEVDADISELEVSRTVEVAAAVLLGHSTRSGECRDAVRGWGAREPRLRSFKTVHFLLLNAFTTENATRLGEAGGVLAVVDIMHKNRDDPDTMMFGWDLLSMLTDDNPANCDLMFSSEATLPYAACLLYMLLKSEENPLNGF
jgi:hypothetical protein